MSVRNSAYWSASYAPCNNCNEGALVWDDTARASRCGNCGEYTR